MIQIQDIRVSFAGKEILKGANMQIRSGNFASIIGPSGCGKTTLLKTINALVSIDSGKIMVNNQQQNQWKLADLRKYIAYVIQQESLFPHMPVWKNIALPAIIQNSPDLASAEKITAILSELHLNPKDVWNKLPSQLSGGQKQRVAIARALIMQPEILLLDEPFSALDPVTKRSLQETLKGIHQRYSTTIVMVTHDIHEAFMLSEHIFFMHAGQVIQEGDAQSFLSAPKNELVQSFIESQRYEL